MNRKLFGWDLIPGAVVVMIGAAEVSHLVGIFLGKSFSFCSLIFGGLLAGGALLLTGVGAFLLYQKKQDDREKFNGRQLFWLLILLGVIVSQICMILLSGKLYRTGDMTMETVQTFLSNDAFYAVNPMTRRPYVGGIPSRLKILCLPSLYGFWCDINGVNAEIFVRKIVPIAVLLCTYGAYITLAKALFPQMRKHRLLFLCIVGALFWASGTLYGMDGFDLLYSGWRGVTIRNCILMPWTVSLCLRRKWILALICVAAEACIAWTLYGAGVCVVVLAGIFLASFLCRREAEE